MEVRPSLNQFKICFHFSISEITRRGHPHQRPSTFEFLTLVSHTHTVFVIPYTYPAGLSELHRPLFKLGCLCGKFQVKNNHAIFVCGELYRFWKSCLNLIKTTLDCSLAMAIAIIGHISWHLVLTICLTQSTHSQISSVNELGDSPSHWRQRASRQCHY